METLCDDTIYLICNYLVNMNNFQLLMLNTHFRNVNIQCIVTILTTRSRLQSFGLSLRLHSLCLRVSLCLPVVRLYRTRQTKQFVLYTGPNTDLRSNTGLVLGEWLHIDHHRIFPLQRRRVNSIMHQSVKGMAMWDLLLNDIYKKTPDVLLFITI